MNKVSFFLLSAALAFLIVKGAYGQDETLTLSSLIGINQILVIGESYGQSESTDFVTNKVAEYIAGGNCLNVGLEIPSDQQEVLDSAMRGQVSMSDVHIDNVIDHDSYREMLVSFSDQIIGGKCLSVYAINPPNSISVAKDAWMEQKVVKIIDDRPIVLLVGTKHAMKDYNSTDDESSKLLTQRLRANSFGVASVLQHWKPGVCTTKTVRIYDTTTDAESKIYVKEAIGEVSAAMPEKASMVSDGVLVWSCERIRVKEKVDIENNNVVNRN